MPAFENTDIGGTNQRFLTTHWSEIFSARTSDDSRRGIIIESLLKKYWKPVYCYVRRKGYKNEPAKDLTQGFFAEIVLNSNLLERANKAKGRFRTLLLSALECYLTDAYRKENAQKRSPKGRMMNLDNDDMPDIPDSSSKMDPNQVFHYVWATEILDKVLRAVKKECYATNKKIHWRLFRIKIINPIMDNLPSPPMKELCRQYNIENEAKASNMIITVKRCFKRAMMNHFRSFVQSDQEIEEEFNELFRIISGGRAG